MVARFRRFCLLVLLHRMSAGREGDGTVNPWGWVTVAILCEHMAEVTLLAIVPFGLALRTTPSSLRGPVARRDT